MFCVAAKPDEQNRLTLHAAVVLGNPAARAAARPNCVAWPSRTCLRISGRAHQGVAASADVSKANVLHQSWIQITSQPDLFQDLQHKGIEWRVAEAAGFVATHWRSYSKRYDDVVWVLLGAVFMADVSAAGRYTQTLRW